MESDYNQDLPLEILDKLRNLELELEDGDITLKGFEKKKASLLASNPTTPTSPIQKTDAEILEELGPEPSAADVVDFLDFLPSPTHSPPTRNATANIGATFMEENHRQLQQQPQHQQPQPQLQQPQLQQQQMQHQPYPQQVRPIQTQYRPYNQSRPIMNNPSYYQGSPLPNNTSNNRPPYNMVPRPQPQQPQPQQRPMNIPPVIYNTNQNIPQQTSPRPMYRPQPRPNTNPNPNYQPYRPQQQQQQQQQQVYSQPNNSMRNSELQYGNYPYNNSNGVNRSLSTNTGTNMAGNHTDQRQYHSMSMYSTRSDSMEWNQ
ncbi:hypothetical protein BDF21DRAFT_409365 [Thamnidium elegans]|nr:hypothetical protein BDF21DRAFT_409365 [Thamnidium elegans]